MHQHTRGRLKMRHLDHVGIATPKNISFPPKAASNSCRDLLLNILGFHLDFISLSRFLDKMPTFAGAGEMRRQNVGFISRDNNDIGMTFLAETLRSHNPEERQFCTPGRRI